MRNSIINVVLGIGLLSGCTQQEPQPNLAGQDIHLTVVHTADLHSRFFPYYFAPNAIDKGLGLIPKAGHDFAVVGGIGRVSTVVKCIRGFITGAPCDSLMDKIGPPAARSIHVDSGDIFEGAPVFNQFQGEVEMRGMSGIGVTAMALGNHEFDKGALNFAEQYTAFGAFPIMAANYDWQGTSDPNDELNNPAVPELANIMHPFTQVNVGGLKIGIVGMGNLSSMEGLIQGGNSLGIRPLDAQQSAIAAVAAVRSSVDMVMIISHLGLDEDEGDSADQAEAGDQNTAIAMPGVDVIFGGHLHIVLDPPKDLPHVDATDGHVTGHTVLCHSGAFAKYVGRLDLVVHVADPSVKGDSTEVKSYTYRIIPIDDSIPSDPEMDNMLESYQLRMNEALNLTQTYAVIPCPSYDAGNCPKAVRTDPDGGDSQIGNLLSQSMRIRPDVAADYAVTNSLGIRDDFESGPLNLEEMYNVFPFDNFVTTMFLSGDETQQMFDAVAARSAERGCKSQAQVAGIYMDLVCNQDASDIDCNARLGKGQACAKNIYLGDNCRAADGTFTNTKCKPLDKYGEYRVAVNDYIATGGSGFTVLQRNTTKFNTGISLRDALVDYIRQLPNRCTDAASYTNIVGVNCKDAQNEIYDCTATCSGSSFNDCTKQGLKPANYDYRSVTCLGADVDAHDGRLQMYPDAQRKM
jgi:5'-nucleotidase / UDP-sugar diphosphatase